MCFVDKTVIIVNMFVDYVLATLKIKLNQANRCYTLCINSYIVTLYICSHFSIYA